MLPVLLATVSAHAQETGTLEGQVTDAATGEELIGVNITIQGTNFGAATDLNGNYEIRNIRPGTYNVQATYIGFDRMLFTGIRIEAGETTTLDIEMTEEILTAEDEVVIIGERPIFDIEESGSSSRVTRDDIDAAPVHQIDEVIGRQAGVIRDPTGIYIRGGRAEETGYVVDGVSAQDPLSGTGMGLDLGAGALQEVEVTTGGIDVEHGNVTSGVVSVQTREGGEEYSGYFSHQRDHSGGSDAWISGFATDVYEFNLGGPSVLNNQVLRPMGIGLPGTLSFFVTAQANITDQFFGYTADQLESSLYQSNFWAPRMDNRWSGMARLTWRPRSAMRVDAAYQRSSTINQNTRMLQIVGDDVQIRPGFQFFHALNLDNANTYTHDSKLAYVRWTHTLDSNTYYRFQISRLFTRLRADANGMDWRPERVDGDFDPESIVVPPVSEFETGEHFRYVLPGPGLANNEGLATLWHDHYAEQYTMRGSLTRYFFDQSNRLRIGFEMVFNDYQWIDITRPWVGAPIAIGEDAEDGDETLTQTSRLGESSDIWDVRPRNGAIYFSDQVRYRGLIANLGARLEYWFPGDFVDDMVDNPDAPIPDQVREAYHDNTYGFFGHRFKMRLLPRISVSFPVRENQMMYFNYGHQTKLPHPSHLYAGLDPFYQDRSFLATLGNPNLDPEVDISYEIGIRNQLTENDALNISAFWSDKYDFITSERILITDVTGREVERAYRVNGDFARVRGLEVTYIKRYSDWFRGNVSGTYQRAEGLSSTSQDALRDLIVGGQTFGSNVETPLAWDRPWDFRANATFRYDRPNPLMDIPGLNQFQMNISGYYRSGIRYTPSEFIDNQRHPITGERNWRPIYQRSTDPSDRFSESGPAWYELDLSFQKWFQFDNTRLRLSLDVTNLLNTPNAAIINPVTADAYRTDYPTQEEIQRMSDAEVQELRNDRSYDVPSNVRDPRYVDPRDNNRPDYMNPANFLKPRHIMFGVSFEF